MKFLLNSYVHSWEEGSRPGIPRPVARYEQRYIRQNGCTVKVQNIQWTNQRTDQWKKKRNNIFTCIKIFMLYVPPGFALGINVEIKILKWRTNPCEHIYSLFCFQDSYMCMYAWILPYVGATTWLLKPPRWVCAERVANIREEILSFAAPSEVFSTPIFPGPAS